MDQLQWTSDDLFWTQQCIFQLYETQDISFLVEDLLTSKGTGYMEIAIY